MPYVTYLVMYSI